MNKTEKNESIDVSAISQDIDKRKIQELQQKEKEMEFRLTKALKEAEFYKGLVNRLTTYSE